MPFFLNGFGEFFRSEVDRQTTAVDCPLTNSNWIDSAYFPGVSTKTDVTSLFEFSPLGKGAMSTGKYPGFIHLFIHEFERFKNINQITPTTKNTMHIQIRGGHFRFSFDSYKKFGTCFFFSRWQFNHPISVVVVWALSIDRNFQSVLRLLDSFNSSVCCCPSSVVFRVSLCIWAAFPGNVLKIKPAMPIIYRRRLSRVQIVINSGEIINFSPRKFG
jgi:hypothetical protein